MEEVKVIEVNTSSDDELEAKVVERTTTIKDLESLETCTRAEMHGLITAQHEMVRDFLKNKLSQADFEEFKSLSNTADDIEAEYEGKLRNIRSVIDAKIASAKELVVALGRTVKSGDFEWRYARGKTTWDSKLLSGYAVAHPEVNNMKLVHAPTVALYRGKHDVPDSSE